MVPLLRSLAVTPPAAGAWASAGASRFVQVPQPDVSHFAAVPGLVGVLDVVAAAARRVDFTVGGRLYWFHRDSYNGNQDFPIPGPTSIRLQVGLRWLR